MALPALAPKHVVLSQPVFNTPEFVDFRSRVARVLEGATSVRIETVPELVVNCLQVMEHAQITNQRLIEVVSAEMEDLKAANTAQAKVLGPTLYSH